MTFDELLAKYQYVCAENDRLKSENIRLANEINILRSESVEHKAENGDFINQLSVDMPDTLFELCEEKKTVNKYSPVDEKIDLFMSLFIGREDVYAKRWYSTKTEKSGYQPVCGNEWGELCDKQKYKCGNCPNRKLLPINRKAIYNHLSGKDTYGRDVLGIYPMLEDETCRFLAIDFDESDFKEAVSAFTEICRFNNIPAYVERSRSGNGAHVWIFFSEPVESSAARKMGSCLLTRAMDANSKVKFTSYDRLFPNQDTIPKGGFGNLIALPMQGLARKNGNSVFLNTDFKPFEDQWAFLSTVKTISASDVNEVINKLCNYGELGVLVKDNEEKSKPWEIKKDIPLTASDFSESTKIVCSNMLYIEKQGLSHRAINKFRRLAAFRNPDFYKSQAMRLPIYNKPRIISASFEDDEYIGLPRGCEENLISLLNESKAKYTIDNKTNCGNSIDVSFNGELRENQIPAAEAMLSNKNGVLAATTAFGKTVIGAYLISRRKVNTLVLVHTSALMNQWKSSLDKFLNINAKAPEKRPGRGRQKQWSPIGVLGSGKDNLSGIVDVAIMQSLLDGDEVKELVRNYGMIIVDECHHIPAVNFERILKFANAEYVYGLSATPSRQDGHHPLIFMQCGPVRYLVDAKSQAQSREFSHYIIPRFTSFRSLDSKDKTITQIYTEIMQSGLRNRQIIEDALYTVQNGRTPIIITERTEHIELLKNGLSGRCKNVITLMGKDSAKEKREAMAQLNGIGDDEPLIIIASGKYIGEGFDYPRLDTLLLAMPIAWKGKVAQYAGRLHRNYTGKNEVQILDYVDIRVPVLERMYQKRLKSYASIGYQTRTFEANIEKPGIIYDGKSFLPIYNSDIENATHEVIIVSPFMRKSRVSQFIKNLTPLIEKGVLVTVITRPPEDFDGENSDSVVENINLLRNSGIKVKLKSEFHQKFTIIDNTTVWYGSVNFLSFGFHEESIMRFESKDIASELLESVE